MKKGWIIFIVATVAFLALYFIFFRQTPIAQVDSMVETSQSRVKIGGQTLRVDMAITPADREKGLSGRESLSEDEGLLFVFDTAGKYGFWMKDMNFAIDMIWVGENLEVVYIKENATPDSFPRVFTSLTNSKYVLETVSGFSQKYNIQVGDKLEILP